MNFSFYKNYFFTFVFFFSIDAMAQCPVANSCTPGNAVDGGFGCGIFNVTLNTINNTTGGVANGYQDYSCTQGTSLIFGVNYNLSIQTGANVAEDIRIWIDYNNDGTFDPINELAFSSDNKMLHSGIINIPSTAILNQALRMRIASDYGTALTSPCSTSQYSQTEDYRITVLNNTNPPTANFQSTDTLTCTGTAILQDLSLNAPTSWKWYFGDTDSSSLQNPSHTYASGGYYTVTLIATNGVGTDTVTKTSYVHFNTSSAISSTCTPLTTNFCCSYGISNVSFNTINNASQDASEGYKDFTCSQRTTVQEGKKYTITITTSGTNTQDSKVYMDFNNDGSFNNTDELVYQSYNTVNPSGIIIIPGTAVLNTPIRMRVMSDYSGGTYDACTVDRGQAEDYTITVIPNTSPPAVDFAADTVVSCRSNFIFADSTDNIPTSWLWTFGDGDSSTLQNPNHSYASPGIYTVTLKTCNIFGCDSLSKSNYINYTSICPYCTATGNGNYFLHISNVSFGTINNSTGPEPNGYGDYTAVSSNLLAGSSYNISVTGGTYFEYLSVWIDYNRNNVFESSENVINSDIFSGTYSRPSNPIIIPSGTSAGPTRMRVLISLLSSQVTPCGGNITYGEVEDYTVNIVSNTQPPLPDFSSANTATCSSIVNFTDATTGNVTSRLWSFGDGATSILQSPGHTYNVYGTYTVKLKTCNSYGCDSVTKSNYITYSAICSCCAASGNASSSDYISYVGLNSIGNVTGQSTSGYGNYTSVSTNLTQRLNYTLNVHDGAHSGAYYNAWIDYNNDNIFSASEQILNSYQYDSALVGFTIPDTAVPGTTRMRVILSTAYSAATSCATGIDGEVEDYTINIIQNTLPPLTNFYSSNVITCTSTVAFGDTSSNFPTSWLWNFGDGTTSTLQNPSHTYSVYGTYTVKLKTCNTYGCDSVTKSNYITYSAICAYCTASGNASSSDYISYVGLDSIVNSTGQSASGYSDYTSLSTNLGKGKSYSLIVLSATFNGGYFNAWIDYNHDDIFSSSEQILNAYQSVGYASFTVPATALAGITRMRIIFNTSNSALTSCANGFNGEVEDYSVNITYCVSFNNNSALWIDSVGMATFSKLSSNDPNGYGDFTASVIPLSPGNSYNLSVEVNNYSSANSKVYFSVWVDFNGNGLFSNVNERFTGNLTYPNRNVNMNIIVPNTAIIGSVRMRILTSNNQYNYANPCPTNMNGEIEDYTIQFIPNTTGIQNVTAASGNSLIVSPNPNDGIFDVNINVPDATDLSLQIINTMGETVKEEALPAGKSFTRSYDLSGLASGMYYVKLIIDQKTVVIKKVITQ
jgi:PKD repeat protein